MTTLTSYKLTIPRAQYDRLADDKYLIKDDTYFRKYDPTNDTTTFVVTEEQRARFAQYATEANREKKKTGHLYWITQMFLEENINIYMKG